MTDASMESLKGAGDSIAEQVSNLIFLYVRVCVCTRVHELGWVVVVGVNMCTYVCACVKAKVRYLPHPLLL